MNEERKRAMTDIEYFIENYCVINGKKIKLTDTQKESLKLIGSGKRICHIKHRC